MLARSAAFCVVVFCIVCFTNGADGCEPQGIQAPCAKRGGVCVLADRCKSGAIGTNQEQSTLCPLEFENDRSGVCCPKDHPDNGVCNDGPSAGSICMSRCGISVRWPASGCSDSCEMCCTLVR